MPPLVPTADISVLIPTYGRPRDLERCLGALTRQLVAPAQVVVVARTDDAPSRAVALSFDHLLPLQIASIERAGQVQALNRGLATLETALVAITDDDACPRTDWLQRIVAHFVDPTVGAVGGRDVVHWNGSVVEGRGRAVGRVEWFGRVVGNHHLDGFAQDVQFLKGANMSFRRQLLPGFDENLLGDGAQICNDMHASLRVSASGWRVIWDPCVAIDHFPAARLDADDRLEPTFHAIGHVLHNQTYTLLSLLSGWRRVATFVYPIMIGSRSNPGAIMLPVALLTQRDRARSMLRFGANLYGRVRGLRTYVRTRGQPKY